MPTLEQIQEKMKKLRVKAESMLARQAQIAVDQIRELMIKHGLTTADIEARAKARREGKGATRRVASVKAMARASAKGVLPAKYRDPKTGATWSGHARLPAWIKDVKDRSKFLIAGASAGASTNSTDKSKATATPVSKAASRASCHQSIATRR